MPNRDSASHPPKLTGDNSGGPKPPPPPDVSRAAATPSTGDGSAVDVFTERVRLILAQHHGMTATGRAMLDSEARRLGLTRQQADAAIHALRGGDLPLPNAPPAGSPTASPKAPPVQAPPADSPQIVFGAYVREALVRSSKTVLSCRKETRLIEEGVQKLGLSRVLARQVVHGVALGLGKGVASHDADSTEAEQDEDLPQPPGLPDFLERALAILAEQRGINARSRVLLAAAAGEFGLSDAEMERGIAALTASVPDSRPQDAWLAEREQAYRDYLCELFARLPQRVATSRMQEAWGDAGEKRHGLQRDRAEHLVRVVAAEQGVRVVTEEQATEHVAALVQQLLTQAGNLDKATRARIFNEGGQWGLTPIQVDGIVRDRMRAKGRAETAFPWRTALAAGVGVGGLFAAVGFLMWLFVFRQAAVEDTPFVQAGSDAPSTPLAPLPPPIESPTGDEWWARDEDLLVAVTQTRALLPEMKGVLAGLNAQRPEDRAAAHRELVRKAATLLDQADHRLVLQDLLAGCLVAEPSDQCAAAIVDELLALMPAVGDGLPEREAGFEPAFWAIRTVITACTRPNLGDARRTQLASEVERKIGAATDLTRNPLDLQRESLAASCRHLYRVIIAATGAQPLVARPLFEYVTREAERYLDLPSIERANVDFLAAALPVAGESWREFANQIQRCADSANPLIVLQLVELFEQLDDSSLQAFLADRLLRRAGVFPQSMSPDQVAKAVRKALGADDVVSGSSRLDALTRAADEVLAADAASPRDVLLQQIVDLAHIETLACAAAQGTVGDATFDALQRDGPVRLAGSQPTTAGDGARHMPERKAAVYQRDNVRRYIQYLLNPRGRAVQRNVFLRSIASLAPNVPDLELELAEKLAAYLMRPKPDEEHVAILDHVAAIGRWQTVRLSLADQVLDTNLQADRVQDILMRVLPHGSAGGDDPMWRQRAYEALLDSVLQDLATSTARSDVSDKVYDQLSDALRESYVLQARLLGATVDDYGDATSPSEVLRLIIESYVARRPPQQDPSASRDQWQLLPYQVEAASYVGHDDLQRTVLLQRLWLRTLATSMEGENPGIADDVRGLVSGLEQSDKDATDLFVQLNAGHRALLRLWMLGLSMK